MRTPLTKIIKRNNVKICYSCTNNIFKIIDNHNKKLINKPDWKNKDSLKHSCNCIIQNECPLENKCNLDRRRKEAEDTPQQQLPTPTTPMT